MISTMLNKILLLRQAFFKKINMSFYSQFGEDKILNELISKKFIKGFYVDVGCYHPKKHSNTQMLYSRGWFGINVDMEIDKIDTFNLARPNDYNYLGAVSDKIEKVKIFRNQKYGVSSTINPNSLNKKDVIDAGHINTVTLNTIINNSPFKNKEIDLLNIDTEGNDFKVLKSLDFKIYNPKIIIIETHLKNIEEIIKSDIYLYLTQRKYILKFWNIYSLIFTTIDYENI